MDNLLDLNFIWKLRQQLIQEANCILDDGTAIRNNGYKIADKGYDYDPFFVNPSKKRSYLLEEHKLAYLSEESIAEGNRILSIGRVLIGIGHKLRAIANLFFIDAVEQVHGNVKIEFKNYNSEKHDWEFHLETGEIFKP